VIHGQTDLKDIPYNIDIKKNIKNIKTINLSNIGKELSYIPLETTPECLIQSIDKILFSDSYIFVSEIRRLLQFDRNGKFIRQIGSVGRGPEEFTYLGDFCIDEQKKEIYITSINPSRLLIFSFNGVFKNAINLSFRPAQIIIKDQNNLMYHLWNSAGENDPSWIFTNRQGVISASIKKSLKRVSQPSFTVKSSPIYSFDNAIHFMEFGSDTLYYFKDNQRKPYAIFSLGDLKMNPDPVLTPPGTKNRDLLTDKLWTKSIYENDEFLFINFALGITDGIMHAIYNKKTADVTFLKDNVFRNDLGGSKGFWPKQIINDKILVDCVDAFDLLKSIKKMKTEISTETSKEIPKQLSNIEKQITESSNPVLIILK
jgi:hypothetical protein